MPSDYKYAKFIGLLLGMLFGNALILVPSVLYRLWGHDSTLPGDVHALGPQAGVVYGLLGTIPVAFLAGLIFGTIGYWCGRGLEEAAKRESPRKDREATQDPENTWPPPPKSSLKEPHDVI